MENDDDSDQLATMYRIISRWFSEMARTSINQGLFLLYLTSLLVTLFFLPISAWSNGGYSADPSNLDYGTHDWFAQHALDWLPSRSIDRSITDILHTLYVNSSNVNSLSPVVINEFELNPSGDDKKLTVLEWVELYNPTTSSIDIGGWELSTTHRTTVTITIPSGTTVEANGYYVFERGQLWLDNKDESIILKNSSGAELDRTPLKSDTDNDNYCWARFPNGYDTDSSLDWRFQLATKGEPNERTSSSITCMLSEASIEVGLSLTVSGAITPPRSGVVVDVRYTMPDTTLLNRTTTSNSSGGYSDTYSPSVAGSWSVEASWAGDSMYLGATSDSVSFTASKISTALTCSLLTTSITLGDALTVSGIINPALSGTTVTVTYTKPDESTFNRTIITDSGGSYNDTYTPAAMGSWSVLARWNGDATYTGATSLLKFFIVSQNSTTISCFISSTSLTIGSDMTISGAITPSRGEVTVTLSYMLPNASVLELTVTSASDGSYIDTYTPSVFGSWSVTASWEGDAAYAGATSPKKSFIVSKILSTITCSASPPSLIIGEYVTVSGALSPALSGETVTLSYKSDGTWDTLTIVTSASEGSYSYSWKPATAGSYQVTAAWSGDITHSEAASDVESITVTKISTTISCSVSRPSNITLYKSINVVGFISPIFPGKTVILSYENRDRTPPMFTRIVTTGSDGSYSDIYTPDMVGSWTVSASWEGDSTCDGSTSSKKSFTVKKRSGCIIATTTYGSELSPEVQFLRNFRDNMVLPTFAGSSFMAAFNSFYYSFSPNIASIIADHEPIRSVMKVVLYPLIGILHISAAVFTVFSFNPEFSVVTSGLVASVLIALIYITPWILLICLLRRFIPPEKFYRWAGFVWMGSVFTVAVAGSAGSAFLMITSTSIFVVTTMAVTVLIVTRQITKRYAC